MNGTRGDNRTLRQVLFLLLVLIWVLRTCAYWHNRYTWRSSRSWLERQAEESVGPPSMEKVATWNFDRTAMVCCSSNRAYVAQDNGLEIFERDALGRFRTRGILTFPAKIKAIDAEQDLACICAEDGVHVLKWSKSGARQVGFRRTPDNARFVFVRGRLAYLADADGRITVFDLSHNGKPRERAQLSMGSSIVDMSIGNNLMAVVTQQSLHFIGTGNRVSPRIVSKLLLKGRASVCIAGHTAYVADGSDLTVVDLTVPDSLRFKRINILQPGAHDIQVLGKYAYIAYDDSVVVLDVSEPFAPHKQASYRWSVASMNAMCGHMFIVGHDGQVTAVEVPKDGGAIPPVPLMKHLVYPLKTYAISAGMGRVYFATGEYLHIIDVSDPRKPHRVGVWRAPEAIRDIVARSDHAYIADGAAGLRIVDVSDPSSPKEIGFCPVPPIANSVDVMDTLAVVGDDANRIWAVDLDDPTNPGVAGSCRIGGKVHDVAIDDDSFCYAAAGEKGLYIIDMSDLASPRIVASLNTGGNSRRILCRDNALFIADGVGLSIAMVADPYTPEIVHSYSPSGRGVWDVVPLFMRRVAIVAGPGEIEVLDVKNPVKPVIVASLEKHHSERWYGGYALASDGMYIYEHAGENGLAILGTGNGVSQRIFTDSFEHGTLSSPNWVRMSNVDITDQTARAGMRCVRAEGKWRIGLLPFDPDPDSVTVQFAIKLARTGTSACNFVAKGLTGRTLAGVRFDGRRCVLVDAQGHRYAVANCPKGRWYDVTLRLKTQPVSCLLFVDGKFIGEIGRRKRQQSGAAAVFEWSGKGVAWLDEVRVCSKWSRPMYLKSFSKMDILFNDVTPTPKGTYVITGGSYRGEAHLVLTTPSNFVRQFDPIISDKVIAEYAFRMSATNFAELQFAIKDQLGRTGPFVSILDRFDRNTIKASSGTEKRKLATYSLKSWHLVRVCVNCRCGTYDLYLDGALIGDDLRFESPEFGFPMGFDWRTEATFGGSGSVDLDELKIYVPDADRGNAEKSAPAQKPPGRER